VTLQDGTGEEFGFTFQNNKVSCIFTISSHHPSQGPVRLVGVFLVDYFDLASVGMINSHQWMGVFYLEEGRKATIPSMKNCKTCAFIYVEVTTCNLKESEKEL
jgi:hypothetical protein